MLEAVSSHFNTILSVDDHTELDKCHSSLGKKNFVPTAVFPENIHLNLPYFGDPETNSAY